MGPTPGLTDVNTDLAAWAVAATAWLQATLRLHATGSATNATAAQHAGSPSGESGGDAATWGSRARRAGRHLAASRAAIDGAGSGAGAATVARYSTGRATLSDSSSTRAAGSADALSTDGNTDAGSDTNGGSAAGRTIDSGDDPGGAAAAAGATAVHERATSRTGHIPVIRAFTPEQERLRQGYRQRAAALVPSPWPSQLSLLVPVMRRLLMAQLLKAWLRDMHRQLPAEPQAAAALAGLVRKLFEVHVGSVVERSALEYFHISKAGGTSWTVAAKSNNCPRPAARGCRVKEFDDSCRWLNRTALVDVGVPKHRIHKAPWGRYGHVDRLTRHETCAKRYGHVQRRGFVYTTNEYTLHGDMGPVLTLDQRAEVLSASQVMDRLHSPQEQGSWHWAHLCPQFVNILTVREPGQRLLSNINFMLPFLQSQLFPVRNRNETMAAAQVAAYQQIFCNAPPETWETLTPPVADNYNIRTLLGELGFHLPLWGVGPEHVAAAESKLLHFDMVLDLNAGSTAADLVQKQGLGWHVGLAEVHALDSRERHDRVQCGLGNLTRLLERQGPDRQWYSFARVVSALDQSFLAMARGIGLEPLATAGVDLTAAAAAATGTTRQNGVALAEGGVADQAATEEQQDLASGTPCGLLGLLAPLAREGPDGAPLGPGEAVSVDAGGGADDGDSHMEEEIGEEDSYDAH
ncbi:hypothetical protein HYH02_012263 [Chlamydomonas schloesseri]|uniref:Uncharacterized protein n=1 Tax=Chlamydomonas schloesseri TaxID=2026947 RepID=A0A835T207_9CHLO|nr:hypothetical protein HYH02_012263 [Chlamydomonas schloesseri]|eukprot:KAG2434433.1 hypothetical protein HYH02_012263 [Chlamydomonas schloesseri]